MQAGIRKLGVQNPLGQRHVAPHFAFDLKVMFRVEDQISVARIFLADAASELPKLECERRATRGLIPNRHISSVARMVMSANSSAVGSALM